MNAIEVRNLRKEYPTFRLQDVSFDIPEGYITGFIGPNGSGKTTTIRSILGMARYEKGNITILGRDSRTEFSEIAPDIGVVLDSPLMVNDWTIRDVEQSFKPFYPNWDSAKYAAWIQKFGIDSKKKVKELSRGMKVKLSIAVALSHGAKLLILDEPTSGLDPAARDELCDILADFVTDEACSIVFSTHITSDLEKIADFIVFILNGEIVFSGPKDELMEKYVLIKGGEKEMESLPIATIGMRKHGTGFEAMVERSEEARLPQGILIDRLSMEDIIVFMNREVYHD